MQKNSLKYKKKFLTSIACSHLILLSNTSELLAKYLSNDVEELIKTFEVKDINKDYFRVS